MTPARLVVDATRCDGHAICVLACPELIRLDDWGYAAAEDLVISDPPTLRRAEKAVAMCPAGAIRLAPAG